MAADNEGLVEVVNGKKCPIHPLTFGDRKKIKEAHGVDIFAMDKLETGDQMDAIFNIVAYGLKKANPDLQDADIDELPLARLKSIQEALLEGIIDRPTST